MSGRASRDKGSRTERTIVRLLQENGFAAEKISGMYKPGSDISIPLLGVDRRCEVKARGDGFRQLYRWLEHAEILIVKADRLKPLVIVPLRLATEIAALAERAKNSAREAEVAAGRIPSKQSE